MMQHNLAQTFGLYTQYIMRLLTFRGMCIYILTHTQLLQQIYITIPYLSRTTSSDIQSIEFRSSLNKAVIFFYFYKQIVRVMCPSKRCFHQNKTYNFMQVIESRSFFNKS